MVSVIAVAGTTVPLALVAAWGGPEGLGSTSPLQVDVAVADPWTEPPAGSSTDGSFASCDAARAAGAAPVHRGDPRYGAHLDGDGDGVACE